MPKWMHDLNSTYKLNAVEVKNILKKKRNPNPLTAKYGGCGWVNWHHHPWAFLLEQRRAPCTILTKA
jgi:hypothetical protein